MEAAMRAARHAATVLGVVLGSAWGCGGETGGGSDAEADVEREGDAEAATEADAPVDERGAEDARRDELGADEAPVDEDGAGDAEPDSGDALPDAPLDGLGAEDGDGPLDELEAGDAPLDELGAGDDGGGRLFSFAVMTDVHIGEGYDDYGTEGHDDFRGDEYEVTAGIRYLVSKVNMAAGEYDIAFVMVLGDLSDSGERSELTKCKEILDQLEVPYFPLLGNHDVWPYSAEGEAEAPIGDGYLETVFAPQFEELAAAFEGFVRAPTPVWNPERGVDSRFVNYAFDYMGRHFVALDLVTREHAPLGYPGVGANADLHDFAGGTWQWFTDHLDAYGPAGDDTVFLFSHHPPIVTSLGVDCLDPAEYSRIDDWIGGRAYADSVWGFFSGHHHLDYELTAYRDQRIVVTPAAKEDTTARVVQVFADGAVDYGTLL